MSGPRHSAVERDRVESCYAILSDRRAGCAQTDFGSRMPAGASSSRRAFLRRLLSAYLQTDPVSVAIGYGAHGKPCLANGSEISFNLSHAEDTATVAIALQREVGVDIEAVTHDVDIDAVARQAFSPTEIKALASLAPAARREAFFRIWVRKEAYIKARGEGLSYPTQSFTVSHLPRDDDALLMDDGEARALSHWRIAEISAPTGFRAALAAEGRDWSVLQMETSALAFR